MIDRERSLRRHGRFLVALFASLLCAAPVSAQVLRGTVRDSASQAPIPGAVLVFLDASGNSIGRNITNEQGRFAIALDPAMRRIQVLRIGFRPRTVDVPSSPSGELAIAMPLIPRLLDIVSVVDQPNCPRRPDRPTAFALWEQTRSALLASVVAREANPADVVRLQFVRLRDRDDGIISQSVSIDSGATSRPFVASRAAAAFVARGFAGDSARLTWFYGPDAEVLLDDAFARGYCFRVADADRERPTQLGIAFSPAQRARGRVDIEGVAWIDTTRRVLTDIVFQYVGVDRDAERMRPGGRISFRTMDNGTVMIDRWFLRTPGAGAVPIDPHSLHSSALTPLFTRETGGEVAHARWPDGREWQASLGRVRGTVTGTGNTGTELRLLQTDYRAIVDSTGSFEISNLLPGPYTIGAFDSTLAVVDASIATDVRFIAERDSTASVGVTVPSAYDFAASLCESAPTAGSAILLARVDHADGSPVEGARFTITEIGDGTLRRVAQGSANRGGLVLTCRIPSGATLQVRAEARVNQRASSALATIGGKGGAGRAAPKLLTVRLQLTSPPEP